MLLWLQRLLPLLWQLCWPLLCLLLPLLRWRRLQLLCVLRLMLLGLWLRLWLCMPLLNWLHLHVLLLQRRRLLLRPPLLMLMRLVKVDAAHWH